jgi:predicted MPP superfamily phosphohydrolase
MPRLFKTKLRAALVVVFVLFAALVVWAFWLEPSSLTVRHVNLSVPRWHEEHRGLKIAVLTDLHVGSRLRTGPCESSRAGAASGSRAAQTYGLASPT